MANSSIRIRKAAEFAALWSRVGARFSSTCATSRKHRRTPRAWSPLRGSSPRAPRSTRASTSSPWTTWSTQRGRPGATGRLLLQLELVRAAARGEGSDGGDGESRLRRRQRVALRLPAPPRGERMILKNRMRKFSDNRSIKFEK